MRPFGCGPRAVLKPVLVLAAGLRSRGYCLNGGLCTTSSSTRRRRTVPADTAAAAPSGRRTGRNEVTARKRAVDVGRTTSLVATNAATAGSHINAGGERVEKPGIQLTPPERCDDEEHGATTMAT